MSVYFCFSFGSRTDHQSAKILVAPRLSRRGCSFRTRERWRLQNKRNAFIGRRARCSDDSSSSVSSASCSKPSGPRRGTWQNQKGRGVSSLSAFRKKTETLCTMWEWGRGTGMHTAVSKGHPFHPDTAELYIKPPHLMVQGSVNALCKAQRWLPRGKIYKAEDHSLAAILNRLARGDTSYSPPQQSRNHLSEMRQAELSWTLIIHVCK